MSTATAGQLRSLSGATGGVTALLLAMAPRRPGLRDLLSPGAALVAAGSALSAAAPSFTVLAAAQAVLGIGIGLLVAVGIAAAGEWPAAEAPPARARMGDRRHAGGLDRGHARGRRRGGRQLARRMARPDCRGLVALALVRLRPAMRARGAAVAASRLERPAVARFAAGELLANAAWASVLTYAGALLLDSYDLTRRRRARPRPVAAAMLPGTFLARRHAARATPALLAALTAFQAGAVVVLGAVRPASA